MRSSRSACLIVYRTAKSTCIASTTPSIFNLQRYHHLQIPQILYLRIGYIRTDLKNSLLINIIHKCYEMNSIPRSIRFFVKWKFRMLNTQPCIQPFIKCAVE